MNVLSWEPAGEQFFELPLGLAAGLGEELLGVVVCQMLGEQEQTGQVNLTRRELVEDQRKALD